MRLQEMQRMRGCTARLRRQCCSLVSGCALRSLRPRPLFPLPIPHFMSSPSLRVRSNTPPPNIPPPLSSHPFPSSHPALPSPASPIPPHASIPPGARDSPSILPGRAAPAAPGPPLRLARAGHPAAALRGDSESLRLAIPRCSPGPLTFSLPSPSSLSLPLHHFLFVLPSLWLKFLPSLLGVFSRSWRLGAEYLARPGLAHQIPCLSLGP